MSVNAVHGWEMGKHFGKFCLTADCIGYPERMSVTISGLHESSRLSADATEELIRWLQEASERFSKRDEQDAK